MNFWYTAISKCFGLALLFILAGNKTVEAEIKDSLEAGQERGYPWIAHSSVECFYLSLPAASAGKGQPYQISLYQGFTIQSLTFASFHIGLRSRDTYALGLSEPYREPLAIKVAGTAEIFRDYLYFTMGGNFPVFSGKVNLSDTAGLNADMNRYSPLPVSMFLSPQALELGAFSQAQYSNWTALGGVTYNRPARFEGLAQDPFFLASYFNLLGRLLIDAKNYRHRFDFKTTIFSDEETENRISAHHEGTVWQLRYAILKSSPQMGWQGGFGAVFKMPDANRRLKLKANLEPTSENDNLHRAYGEFAVSWVSASNFFWRVHFIPKALFSVQDFEFGNETEIGAGLGFSVWGVHRIRGAATFLYGKFEKKDYIGLGMKGEFSFRHLGFQDLEDPEDSHGGGL